VRLIFTISNSPDPGAGVSIDANRYIDINPTAGWTGTTDVEVQVEDSAGLTDIDAFQVTVASPSEWVYLPLVVRGQPPPIPEPPVLNPIDNSDGDGNFSVSWSAVSSAAAYTLEEDEDAAFSSPAAVYSGGDTSTAIIGRDVGTYYYRVRASSAAGPSDWSNVQSVVVSGEPGGPEPGHYTGTSDVSFDVTTAQQVCDFEITVPFESAWTTTCTVHWGPCVDIVDDQFELVEEHSSFGVVKSFRGTFATGTHANGTYGVSMCGSVLISTPSTGSWEASKQTVE
jgi:hypothetical protein